ncbi:MAG: anti-sigma factor [Steroidobacteraceae bacterium]
MQCPESLRVQGYFDAELDALSAADIERHMESCADCRALYQELQQLRTAMREELPPVQAPPELRARIARALDQESLGHGAAETAPPWPPRRSRNWRTGSFWMGAISGLGTAAVAAALGFVLLTPLRTAPLVDELLNAHVDSLLSTHLVDVVSTDRHTVKPWFAGQTDVSPVVADFEPQGYKLVGGRVDYLEHQRAAVVVYRHGAHVINVFSWSATPRSIAGKVTRNGYHLMFWRIGDLQYCAVSDTGWDELASLTQLLQGLQ